MNINNIKTKYYSSKTNTQKGFTLFIAVIVSSLLLAIGFSLGNIVYKQLLLSATGKESQLAFFAADSGAECALFWDRKGADGYSVVEGSFATSSFVEVGEVPVMECGGVPIVIKGRESDELNATTSFVANFSQIDGAIEYRACARVTVIKKGPYTQIDSRGYNTLYSQSDDDCDLSNPRSLERGLQLNY